MGGVRAVVAAVLIGFVAGLLDIVYAFTVYGLRPLTILQSIAAGFAAAKRRRSRCSRASF